MLAARTFQSAEADGESPALKIGFERLKHFSQRRTIEIRSGSEVDDAGLAERDCAEAILMLRCEGSAATLSGAVEIHIVLLQG